MLSVSRLKTFLNKHSFSLLWLGVIVFIGFFTWLTFWKYFHFGYNGLDLAIYNQVFFNSIHGRWFEFSIHPHSYLGDHFEIFIVLLLPIYKLFSHPLTLLAIQNIFLGLAAWPLYLIAKKYLTNSWSLLIAWLWLACPWVQNIALFEFHALPLAIFFLLWAFYFFQKNKFWPWLIMIILALTVREDVSLVVIFFSFFSLLEKRSFRWYFWPLIIGVSWLILAMKVIAFFSPDQNYKFLFYYQWLGNSWPEIIWQVLTRPWFIIQQVATWHVLLFSLTIFLPTAFFSLKKPLYLLFGGLVYLQLIFAGFSNATVSLKIHYPSLLLPWLYLALIVALSEFKKPSKNFLLNLFRQRSFVLILIIAATLYSNLTLGPLSAIGKVFWGQSNFSAEEIQLKKYFLETIPASAAVAATYDFLNNLASRPELYSLHYIYDGHKQFSNQPYYLASSTQYLLIDTSDLLTYGQQFPNNRAWQNNFENGDNRLRNIISDYNFSLTQVFDSYLLFSKNGSSKPVLYSQITTANKSQKINDDLSFLGWQTNNLSNQTNLSLNYLPVTLFFQTEQATSKHYQLQFQLRDQSDKVIYQKNYALAYGLLPTTDWLVKKPLAINHWFLLPNHLANQNVRPFIQIIEQKGFLTLNSLNQAVLQTTDQLIGPAIEIK